MRIALSNFDVSLKRIRDVASDMNNRILSASHAERLRDETLRCASTVILSGFFESFLKECIQIYVSVVCDRQIPFVDLEKKMQTQHFVVGGQLLGQKYKNDSRVSWIRSDYLDIVRRLSSPAGPNGDYTLLWEAYANTEGNPGPTVIDRILENLGVDNRQIRLDKVTSGNYSTLKLALGAFIEVRNECAHTGSALKIPTTANLIEYCDLLFDIANAFISVLEIRLSEAPLGISLNTATASELSRIRGLGPNRIGALIEYRTTNGPFGKVEDLINVTGIGENLVQTIKLYVHI